jgi:hypothetical protein
MPAANAFCALFLLLLTALADLLVALGRPLGLLLDKPVVGVVSDRCCCCWMYFLYCQAIFKPSSGCKAAGPLVQLGLPSAAEAFLLLQTWSAEISCMQAAHCFHSQ